VISACYSGSFVDKLRNDHTLVITAARADRSITYEGRAMTLRFGG